MRSLLALIVFTFTGMDSPSAMEITGKAMFDNQLIYTEKHHAEMDKEGFYLTLSTSYFDKNNTLFAKVTSDFRKNKTVPDSVFEDFRFKTKETVFFEAATKKLIIQTDKAGKSRKQELDLFPNSILSQGFHNAILEQFDVLKDQKKEVYFIVPSKNDQYRFMIEKEKIENGQMTLVISPSHFILKRLLSPIRLTYEVSSKKLLIFQGLTNIDNSKGDSQYAIIEYRYQ